MSEQRTTWIQTSYFPHRCVFPGALLPLAVRFHRHTVNAASFSNQVKCGEKEEVIKQRVERSSGLSCVTDEPEMFVLLDLLDITPSTCVL